MTPKEHIESINENLKVCEDVKKEKPGYYESFFKPLHEALIKIKNELEEKLEQNINDDLQ